MLGLRKKRITNRFTNLGAYNVDYEYIHSTTTPLCLNFGNNLSTDYKRLL